MKIVNKIISCLLIISFSVSVSGCASYRLGRLPSPYLQDYPNPETQKSVSVAVKILSCSDALATFDCEMDKRKINPVYIVIENKSDKVYGFRKADVDASYVSSEEVAKKCSRSTMGRLLSYGVLALCPFTWIVFIPIFIGESINCPTINSRMRSDYTTNEIADATIGPGRSLSGFMFVSPFKSGELFTVPLIEKETGERLLFQFQNSQLGTVCVSPKDAKAPKEAEVKPEPKKNFGP